MSNIRVRIPPSPTGYCHVGTARTAIINYLFAKHNGGFIGFRSEDTEEESKKEAGKTVRVVRLKNPGSTITFTDMIRGDITFDTKELGDFVIARSVDDALYHFAVVVDDAQMGITHIIRGEDHISNTPRQILIQEALGYTRPAYAHYPLLLGADRSKLSKRTGDTSVKSYRDQGFLPEAFF